MHTSRPRPDPPRRVHRPRRTARLRLTVLYAGAVFLACGATVVAFTYLLYGLVSAGQPATEGSYVNAINAEMRYGASCN